MTLTLAFNLIAPSDLAVRISQPAANDILAPRSLTYTSEILTEQAREQERDNVPEVYTPLDLSFGRAQKSQARAAFSFIDTVRADPQATKETKLAYLQQIEGLTIEDEVGIGLLDLSPADYDEAKADVLGIIEELMRQEIRESQLRDFQRAARREASLELSPMQENVVTSLAPQFIVANVFPDPAATAQSREEAATAVEPIVRSITKDQRIVRTGDIVTEVDIELLTELGLLQQELDTRDFISIFMASLVSVVLVAMYWQQFHSRLREGSRYLAALAVVMLLFTLVARLMTTGPAFLLYWFPTAAMSMLLAVIFDIRFAMMVTVVMATLVGYIGGNSLELAAYHAAGGLLSLLTLQNARARRINAFFRAGLVAAVGHIMIILIFHLPQDAEIVDVLQLVLYGLANGILSGALTLVGFFVIGSTFGIITTLQLQELSRLDHPLLQELLRRAPGTYHHSIMVANLAEQAAERVKANATLVRVGAFYHDIGKMNRPPFFTENQEGFNPHDTLDPASSTRIIKSHVSDGVDLARRYRLPDRLRDFIAEHHGDKVLKVFYAKAQKEAADELDTIDISQFRHDGPRPRSRETGIVLLADTIDAASGAIRPNSENAIEKLVNSIIDEDLTDGQLDDSNLTLGDIKVIRASFIETLKGRYHVRVKYPGNEVFMEEEADGEVPAPIVTQRPDPPPSGELTQDMTG
jgi:putative nucleotidyltransferase with HDIG domain